MLKQVRLRRFLASSKGIARSTSDIQLFRKTRKHATTALRNDDHIFLTRSAQTWIIQPGFNRQYLPIFQRNFLQTRMLVDLEPESMACPMKESNAPAFANLRRKTTFCEELQNC